MNKPEDMSPVVEKVDWGSMEVAGLAPGKDFKLWPGGGRPWDWRETGTHHEPGILPGDVEELIAHGARTVVLSRGMLLRLGVAPDTLDLLHRHQLKVLREETRRAVASYNALARLGHPVAGLFHSTC